MSSSWIESDILAFEPMAVAIMFGLLVSTVLTLGVVPVMYAILYRVRVTGADLAD